MFEKTISKLNESILVHIDSGNYNLAESASRMLKNVVDSEISFAHAKALGYMPTNYKAVEDEDNRDHK